MAIAVDATASVDGAGDPGPLAFNHTCTGSDGILWVFIRSADAVVTGVTYNSVAMTQVDTITISGTVTLYAFVLTAPATGTHSVSISYTGSIVVRAQSVSYTGASATAPDAHTTNSSGIEANTVLSLTTVADSCWMIVNCNDTSDHTLTAGTGATSRNASQAFWKTFDSNAALTPAGSQSMTIAHVSNNLKSLVASFAPVAAAGDTLRPQALL